MLSQKISVNLNLFQQFSMKSFQETQISFLNPLSAKPTKWSNALKQFVGNLPTNCLNVFDYSVGLVLTGLNASNID